MHKWQIPLLTAMIRPLVNISCIILFATPFSLTLHHENVLQSELAQTEQQWYESSYGNKDRQHDWRVINRIRIWSSWSTRSPALCRLFIFYFFSVILRLRLTWYRRQFWDICHKYKHIKQRHSTFFKVS
jgi:hypothetical protein